MRESPPRPAPTLFPRAPACALALLAACSAARVPVRPARALPVAAAAPSPAVERSEIQLAPEADATAWLAATEPDGARYIVRGSLRTRATGASYLWADDRFASAITVAAQVDDGWLFVAADGAVARSATFLGPLEPLGELPAGGRAVDTGASRGRIALVDADGALWLSDGRAPFALSHGLPEARRVIGACFADGTHGAALVDRGEVFATRDGGASWQAVDAHGDAAWATYVATDGRIVVRTTGGARSLEGDGTLVVLNPPMARADRGALEPEAQRSVRVAALQRYPSMALAAWGEPARADGTVVLADGLDALAIDAASGRVVRTSRGALPEAGCRLGPWGPAIAARCASGLLRSGDAGESFAPVAASRGLPLDLLLSDDGAHAVGRGAVCGGSSLGALCVLDPEAHAWRLLDAPRPSGVFSELFELHGERLLAGLALVEARVGVVETDTGSATALRLGDDATVHRLEVLRASWVGDAIVAIGAPNAEPGAPRFVLTGSDDTMLAARPLPGGTASVAFADTLRGVAVGRDAGSAYRTLDGGASWTALPMPARSDGWVGGARCTAHGCVIARRVVIDGWGPIAPASERPVASSRAPTRTEPPRFEHVVATTPPCEPVGAAIASRPLPASDAPRIGARRTTLSASGAVARVDAWRAARTGALTLEAHWRLAGDAHFVGRTRASSPALGSAEAETSDASTSRYALRGATRRGALIERCPGPHHERACQLFWARDGGAMVPVAARDAFADATDDDVVIEQTLPLADGGLVVLLRSAAAATAVDLVIELGPDGRVRRRRAFAWHASRASAERAIVRWRGGVYYTVVETASSVGLRRPPFALRLEPIDGGPASSTLFLGGSLAAHVCRSPLAPGSVELETTRSGALAPRTVRARIELTQAAACVRAVISDDGVHLEADPSGALVGTLDDGVARRALRCGP